MNRDHVPLRASAMVVPLFVYGAVSTQSAEMRVTIRPVDGRGMGAFAAEAAPSGRWVCSYHGKLVTREDVELRYPSEPPKYLFHLDDTYSVDAEDSDHVSRFFNHDEFGVMTVTRDEAAQRIDFFTARDVAIGEELTFDCAPPAPLHCHHSDCTSGHHMPHPTQMAWLTGKECHSIQRRVRTAGATRFVGYSKGSSRAIP